jgi:hypothetical protein
LRKSAYLTSATAALGALGAWLFCSHSLGGGHKERRLT